MLDPGRQRFLVQGLANAKLALQFTARATPAEGLRTKPEALAQ
jgi:hypothetical protein